MVDFLEELFFAVDDDFFLVVEVPFLVVDDDFLAVDEGFFVVVVLFFFAVVDFFLAVVDFLVVVEAFFVVGFLVVFVVDISSMVSFITLAPTGKTMLSGSVGSSRLLCAISCKAILANV